MMKWLSTAVLLVFVIIAAFWLGSQKGMLPQNIYRAPANDPNMVQWRQDWRHAGNSIVSADVVSNSADHLYIYLDYIYSGDHGDEVATCGNVIHNGRGGPWSCSPVLIRKGRGFAILRLGISSSAESIACSDAVVVDFYDSKRTTFFRKKIPFSKTWVKGESGLYGKVRELISTCPG